MKKKKIKFAILLIFTVSLFAVSCCDKPETPPTNENNTLQGSKWKLTGIVDVQTDDLTELESKDCDECYTLTFDTDSTFSGRSAANIIWGRYEIDYNTYSGHITSYIISEAGEVGDGHLYGQILGEVQSFTIEDTYPRTLHLYYNDSKNYLKYKEIGG